MSTEKKYGWKRQLPDFRDFKYAAPQAILSSLPPKVDLRPFMPDLYDQGKLGSCTANAIGAGHQYSQIKGMLPAGTPDAAAIAAAVARSFIPSRLFTYYNEREMEGTVSEDAGAILRDGLKCVANQGVCEETMWPYDVSKFTIRPTDDCYTEALYHQVVSYRAVQQTPDQMKGCLAEGYPFVFGFAVYESFESEKVTRTGVVPMPGRREQMLGGHAVLAVGYDDEKQWGIIRNSWGPNWGDHGYFYLPYAYFTHPDLVADFWTIRTVELEAAA